MVFKRDVVDLCFDGWLLAGKVRESPTNLLAKRK
jgi:hypothetical protein